MYVLVTDSSITGKTKDDLEVLERMFPNKEVSLHMSLPGEAHITVS